VEISSWEVAYRMPENDALKEKLISLLSCSVSTSKVGKRGLALKSAARPVKYDVLVCVL
jgi:hypothetical protein